MNVAVHATKPDYRMELTSLGIAQAAKAGEELAQRLGGETVAAYVSPFQRTRQTWSCIRGELQPHQVERVREDPRLREQEWGHLRSEDDTKLIEAERNAYGTFFFRIPDGESGADVYDRCSGFLDTLYRDFEKPHFPANALLVTHGLTLRLLVMRWLHWSVEEFESLHNPRNCEIFELRLDAVGAHYQLATPFRRGDATGIV